MIALDNNTVSLSTTNQPAPGKSLSWIKWIGVVAGLLIIAYQFYRLYFYYTVKLPAGNYSHLRIVAQHFQFLSDIAMPLMAILIFIKSKHATAFYLGLFVIVYQFNVTVPLDTGAAGVVISITTGVVAGILCILSFQYFPVKITPQKIDAAIRYKWLRRYLKTFLHPRALWLFFSLLLLSIATLQYFFSVQSALSDFLILITAFAYLYINFRTTAGKENDSILWLFWGLITYILLVATIYTLYALRDGIKETTNFIFVIISFIVLIFSFGMSLFFTNSFDTGKFVTRTLVNGFLFILVIIIYNTLEHYVLHWLSHQLHISNVMMSSLLSGVLVLFISPLHHRLTHFLNKKLRQTHKSGHS